MNTDTALGKLSALARFGSTKAAAVSTFLGVFVSISAIASVDTTVVPEADTEITKQILLIEDQEDSSRSAHRFEDLLTPRTGLSWQRATFAMVSNPVLVAEVRETERAQMAPEPLTVATLALIEDAAAYEDAPPVDVAPEAAHAPKKRGQAQWHCLAEALYFEARSESVTAQKAVAEVIMNRVDSNRYPNTVCEVVNQGASKRHRCQFSYNCDGLPETIHDNKSWKRAQEVANESVMTTVRPLTDGATHYHTISVRPFWSKQFVRTAKYGVHIFYRSGTRLSSR